jgi:antitoxin component of MazEF toxin-antitoxin module
MKKHLAKWRNTLGIWIRKPVVENAKLREGDLLEIEVAGEGHLQPNCGGEIPSLADLVAQITPQNRYPEI